MRVLTARVVSDTIEVVGSLFESEGESREVGFQTVSGVYRFYNLV